MILDATAGNRTMWKRKQSDNIIYIDIEKQLEVKPTIYADDRQLPFRNSVFDTIFFDPPHQYGGGSLLFTSPYHTEKFRTISKRKAPPTYYGWDKYKTKAQLLRYLSDSSKEFRRVLKDDGLLWMKWSDVSINLHTILALLTDWRELMRIEFKGGFRWGGEQKTYWLCLEKRKSLGKQSTLRLFKADDELPKPVLELRKRCVLLTDYLR